jgi:hypothetical protein
VANVSFIIIEEPLTASQAQLSPIVTIYHEVPHTAASASNVVESSIYLLSIELE